LKAEFTQRFGKGEPPESVMWDLSGKVQYENEDLETFVAWIQKLARNAYPDASKQSKRFLEQFN
jgi:hypothetical protein